MNGTDAANPASLSGEDKPSDRTLLRRFCGGDQDAATELYVRYARRLESLAESQTSAVLASRLDPEDIVQTVFRTFFRRVAEGQYDIPAGDELWKLFLVISLNKIRKKSSFHQAEKRNVRKTVAGGDFAVPPTGREAADETAFTTLRLVVEEVLCQLSQAHRQMVELRIEGHQVSEIAEKTGCSKRSVERILQRFRSQLRELIDAP